MVNYYILYHELWWTLINYYKLIDYGQLLIKYDYYEQPLTSMNHHEPPLTINLINSYTRKTFPWRFFLTPGVSTNMAWGDPGATMGDKIVLSVSYWHMEVS